MADMLRVEADATSLIAALTQLGDRAIPFVKAAAKETADAIVREAKGRIRRAAGGPTRSQHTAEGVKAVETNNGEGYLVVVDSPDMPGLPGWLEHGTKYMTAHPALFPSARLEEGAHRRRVADAVQSAIDAEGLGQ